MAIIMDGVEIAGNGGINDIKYKYYNDEWGKDYTISSKESWSNGETMSLDPGIYMFEFNCMIKMTKAIGFITILDWTGQTLLNVSTNLSDMETNKYINLKILGGGKITSQTSFNLELHGLDTSATYNLKKCMYRTFKFS